MAKVNKFAHAECFQIDPEGKNVLFVYYPENIDPKRLEGTRDSILQIQEELDRWVKEPDNPIYILCLPWDIRVKIGKVAENDISEFSETSEELREKLSELAHNQWSGWMKYLFSRGTFNEDGTWTMPKWAVKRWDRQMKTSFAELSEEERELDRAEVDKFLKVIYSD